MKLVNNDFIVLNTEHALWDFDDYMDKAERIADEKQMPVLLRCPYRRRFIVLPTQKKDNEGYVDISEEDFPIHSTTNTQG